MKCGFEQHFMPPLPWDLRDRQDPRDLEVKTEKLIVSCIKTRISQHVDVLTKKQNRVIIEWSFIPSIYNHRLVIELQPLLSIIVCNFKEIHPGWICPRTAKGRSKGAQPHPKGAQREPNRTQREPKGTQSPPRDSKVAQKETKGAPKTPRGSQIEKQKNIYT